MKQLPLIHFAIQAGAVLVVTRGVIESELYRASLIRTDIEQQRSSQLCTTVTDAIEQLEDLLPRSDFDKLIALPRGHTMPREERTAVKRLAEPRNPKRLVVSWIKLRARLTQLFKR